MYAIYVAHLPHQYTCCPATRNSASRVSHHHHHTTRNPINNQHAATSHYYRLAAEKQTWNLHPLFSMRVWSNEAHRHIYLRPSTVKRSQKQNSAQARSCTHNQQQIYVHTLHSSNARSAREIRYIQYSSAAVAPSPRDVSQLPPPSLD